MDIQPLGSNRKLAGITDDSNIQNGEIKIISNEDNLNLFTPTELARTILHEAQHAYIIAILKMLGGYENLPNINPNNYGAYSSDISLIKDYYENYPPVVSTTGNVTTTNENRPQHNILAHPVYFSSMVNSVRNFDNNRLGVGVNGNTRTELYEALCWQGLNQDDTFYWFSKPKSEQDILELKGKIAVIKLNN